MQQKNIGTRIINNSITGRAFYFTCDAAEEYIARVVVSNIHVKGFEKVVEITANPEGWINGNYFTNISADGCRYLFYIGTAGTGTTDGNMFIGFGADPIKDGTTVVRMIYVWRGKRNIFIGNIWDIHKAGSGSHALYFGSPASQNIAIGQFGWINGWVYDASGTNIVLDIVSPIFGIPLAFNEVYRGDYGGNFANFTPPTPIRKGHTFIAEDTNAVSPAKRLYVSLDGQTWSYVDLV